MAPASRGGGPPALAPPSSRRLLLALVSSWCCLPLVRPLPSTARAATRGGAAAAGSTVAPPRSGNPAPYDSFRHVESARLYGSINLYAYYFADLTVGTPPQRVSVIVDTGSSLCGFPCADCTHCGRHIDKPFDLKASSTAKYMRCGSACQGECRGDVCGYSQTYTEGSSISGVWFKDLVQLGDVRQRNPPVLATLGCHLEERKLFYAQRVNGIMGLAPHENWGRPSILQKLFLDAKHVNTSVFSLCFAAFGGRLAIGGASNAAHAPGAEVRWLPLSHERYYHVTVQGLQLRGRVVAQGLGLFGRALVDSGSTFTYFPTQVYRAAMKVLEVTCAEKPGCDARQEGSTCWRLSNGSTHPLHFPPFSLVFENSIHVDWPATAYLFQRGDPSLWCVTFADNGVSAETVLGVSWMLHKDIIFDLINSRLGVVEALCPEHRLPPGEDPRFHGELIVDGEPSSENPPPTALEAVLMFGFFASLGALLIIVVWLVCRGVSEDVM